MVKQSAQTMGVVRAKNARQKRKLKKEEPKVFENTKVTVLIKGGNVSNTLTQVMHDFHRLKVNPIPNQNRANFIEISRVPTISVRSRVRNNHYCYRMVIMVMVIMVMVIMVMVIMVIMVI